jgi:hypothetical protein
MPTLSGAYVLVRRLMGQLGSSLPSSLASIVAERIVDRLEASGYVVMRGPPAAGAGDRPRP